MVRNMIIIVLMSSNLQLYTFFDLPDVMYLCSSSQEVYSCDLRQGTHPTLQRTLPDQEKLKFAQLKYDLHRFLSSFSSQPVSSKRGRGDLFLGKCLYARGIQRNETNIHLRLPC